MQKGGGSVGSKKHGVSHNSNHFTGLKRTKRVRRKRNSLTKKQRRAKLVVRKFKRNRRMVFLGKGDEF